MISLKLQRLPNDLGNFPPSSFSDKSILMADVRFFNGTGDYALQIIVAKVEKLKTLHQNKSITSSVNTTKLE